MVSILAGFVLCIKKKKKKLIHDQTIQTFPWLAFFFLTYQNIGSISFCQSIFQESGSHGCTGLAEGLPSSYLALRSCRPALADAHVAFWNGEAGSPRPSWPSPGTA